jgi:multimeric flavodoxin WrbA
VECETIRIVDHTIPFGVATDMGEGDEWPGILERIKECEILVLATPIWFGVGQGLGSRAGHREARRHLRRGRPRHRPVPPLYGKVAGAIVTGNEDGAHDAAATTLFNLSHLGCVVPPNSDCYWVGDAGPGPSYIEAGGDKHLYTNKTARYLAHNLEYMAGLFEGTPHPDEPQAPHRGGAGGQPLVLGQSDVGIGQDQPNRSEGLKPGTVLGVPGRPYQLCGTGAVFFEAPFPPFSIRRMSRPR